VDALVILALIALFTSYARLGETAGAVPPVFPGLTAPGAGPAP
jgi:hypothetical protein